MVAYNLGDQAEITSKTTFTTGNITQSQHLLENVSICFTYRAELAVIVFNPKQANQLLLNPKGTDSWEGQVLKKTCNVFNKSQDSNLLLLSKKICVLRLCSSCISERHSWYYESSVVPFFLFLCLCLTRSLSKIFKSFQTPSKARIAEVLRCDLFFMMTFDGQAETSGQFLM